MCRSLAILLVASLLGALLVAQDYDVTGTGTTNPDGTIRLELTLTELPPEIVEPPAPPPPQEIRVAWQETGPANSLDSADTFDVLDTEIVSRGSGPNCHAHTDRVFAAPIEFYAELYVATTAAQTGCGITFASDYPSSDTYARVRHWQSGEWDLNAHPDAQLSESPALPKPSVGEWWSLRVRVPESGAVVARVWRAGASEPDEWSTAPYSGTRHGRIGLWYHGAAGFRWRNIRVGPIGETLPLSWDSEASTSTPPIDPPQDPIPPSPPGPTPSPPSAGDITLMAVTIATANELLDHLFDDGAYTAPSPVYLALSTTTPSADGSGFTEPSGNGYARVAAPGSSWSASSDGAKASSASLDFPLASGSWGTVTHVGVFDAATEGTLMLFQALGTSRAVIAGSRVRFSAGGLSVAVDSPSGGDLVASTEKDGFTISFGGAGAEVEHSVTGDVVLIGASSITGYSIDSGLPIEGTGPQGSGSTRRNGAMKNPAAPGGATYTFYKQGFDGRDNGGYDASLDASLSFPISLSPGDSLIIAASYDEDDPGFHGTYNGSGPTEHPDPALHSAIVIYCADESYRGQMANHFRPPWSSAGTIDPIPVSSLNYSLLPSVSNTSNPWGSPTKPDVATYLARWRRPIIHTSAQHDVRFTMAPYLHRSSYGQYWSQENSRILTLMMTSDPSIAQKQEFVRYVVQRGLDIYGCAIGNSWYFAQGGLGVGNATLAILAAEFLEDATMQSNLQTALDKFEERIRYYEGEEGADDPYLWGSPGSIVSVCAGSGASNHDCRDPNGLINDPTIGGFPAGSYRICCSSNTYHGQALILREMGVIETYLPEWYGYLPLYWQEIEDTRPGNAQANSHQFAGEFWTWHIIKENWPLPGY